MAKIDTVMKSCRFHSSFSMLGATRSNHSAGKYSAHNYYDLFRFFLSKNAIKHKGERGTKARTPSPPLPLIVPCKTSVQTSEIEVIITQRPNSILPLCSVLDNFLFIFSVKINANSI